MISKVNGNFYRLDGPYTLQKVAELNEGGKGDKKINKI